MVKKKIRINDVENMKKFIKYCSKVHEPGVTVYRGSLTVDGSSVIAMMALVDIEFIVEYPETAQGFNEFLSPFKR